MRTLSLACLLFGLVAAAPSWAQQQDRQAAQQQRRLQLQLQQAQQQLQDAQAAKTRLEAENVELKKSLGAQRREADAASGARRQSDQKLRATETQRSTLAASAADLERQLADEKRRSAETIAAKDAELARSGKAAEARDADLQVRFREQVRMVSECTEKNERLVKLGAELIGRYRDKGFAEVLNKREPLLGLGDVALFNLMQDYRDQLDAGRFTSAVPR